jgi:hypothetical protein
LGQVEFANRNRGLDLYVASSFDHFQENVAAL